MIKTPAAQAIANKTRMTTNAPVMKRASVTDGGVAADTDSNFH
jgi:hypothetical protein